VGIVTVRVGFLGGGFIANYHGKMLHTSGADAEIVVVHDPDQAKAAAFAERSGAAIVATEAEVIERSDAVYVTTWTSEHPRLVADVAAAGKAVFCEKPLATNVSEALDMVEAVARAGVTNQVGLVLRESPSFNLLRYLTRRPESGRIMAIVFRDDQYIPIQGQYGSTWRREPDKAGAGTLLEHSIHDLDIIEWLAGPIAEVTGRTANFHEIDGIEDLAVASLALASGGVVTLSSVWHDILSRPSLRRVEVICERAMYVLEGDVLGPVRWTLDGPDGGVDQGSVEGDELLAMLHTHGIRPRNPDEAFIEAVAAGRPADPGFGAALRAHVLAEAIYRSASDAMGPGSVIAIPDGVPGTDWV
jgi:predicted dehydrogenase